MTSRRILGAVLAGGEARRFGADKALALLDGRALADHAADALRPWCEEVVLIGGERPGRIAVADYPAPGLGPLGGLCGALRHGTAAGYAVVLTIACDMPLIREKGLIDRLLEQAPAVVAGAQTLGAWPTSLARALTTYLQGSNRRAILAFAQAVGAAEISSAAPLPNVNRVEELDALARSSGPGQSAGRATS